ncbi:hypothetical protein GCM10027511_34930 [Hymenobacter humi]
MIASQKVKKPKAEQGPIQLAGTGLMRRVQNLITDLFPFVAEQPPQLSQGSARREENSLCRKGTAGAGLSPSKTTFSPVTFVDYDAAQGISRVRLLSENQ